MHTGGRNRNCPNSQRQSSSSPPWCRLFFTSTVKYGSDRNAELGSSVEVSDERRAPKRDFASKRAINSLFLLAPANFTFSCLAMCSPPKQEVNVEAVQAQKTPYPCSSSGATIHSKRFHAWVERLRKQGKKAKQRTRTFSVDVNFHWTLLLYSAPHTNSEIFRAPVFCYIKSS